MTPLMHACRVGNGPIVRLLVGFYQQIVEQKKNHKNKYKKFPIELNKRDLLGRTALHYACIEGNDLICQFLLVKKKFDSPDEVEVMDIDGKSNDLDGETTPLMFACDWGHGAVIDIL